MKKIEKIIIGTIFILLLFLTLYYTNYGDFEFVYYGFLSLVFSIPFLIFFTNKVNPPISVVIGLGVLILINMCAGGIIMIGQERLYDWVVFPIIVESSDLSIIKFDQIVHTFGGLMTTLVLYYLIKSKAKENKYDSFLFAIVILLAGFGASAFYEILELVSTTFENNGVGLYYNTVLDLCSDFLGSLVATIIIIKNRKKLNK